MTHGFHSIVFSYDVLPFRPRTERWQYFWAWHCAALNCLCNPDCGIPSVHGSGQKLIPFFSGTTIKKEKLLIDSILEYHKRVQTHLMLHLFFPVGQLGRTVFGKNEIKRNRKRFTVGRPVFHSPWHWLQFYENWWALKVRLIFFLTKTSSFFCLLPCQPHGHSL